jgi:ATP-dependent Clp protease, protease subunit
MSFSLLSIFLLSVLTSTLAQQGNYSFPLFSTVELEDGNHVVLRGEINEEMISKAIVAISSIKAPTDSEGSSDQAEIILYISSPGGSVLAGNNFIQFMNYLRQKGRRFTCVADFAASMAFSIFQECDNRYVTPSSILMQHQMSVGIQDQYENLKNRIHLLDAINMQSIQRQSRRIGLTVEEFKKKVVSDWWIYGENCVDERVADQVVHVGCAFPLLNETYEEKFEFFGTTYKLVFSKCPLAVAPISYSESSSSSNSNSNSNSNSQDSSSAVATFVVPESARNKTFFEYLNELLIKNTTIRYYL